MQVLLGEGEEEEEEEGREVVGGEHGQKTALVSLFLLKAIQGQAFVSDTSQKSSVTNCH